MKSPKQKDMEQNNIDNYLKPLENIRQVDAPPFLYTRIKKKIEDETRIRVPVKIAWGLTSACCLLLLFNIYVVVHEYSHRKNDLVQQFQLMHDNNLYK